MNINKADSISAANTKKIFQSCAEADEDRSFALLKNNVTCFDVSEYGRDEELIYAIDVEVDEISARLIAKNIKAYEELAK